VVAAAKLKILYIAGVSHCGSTFLGALLGQLEGVFFAGELAHAGRSVELDTRCGCGERLRECTRLVNRVPDRTAQAIFGYPDYLKFRSCMTLFACAADGAAAGALFSEALQQYFAGAGDARTREMLRTSC